MCKRKQYYWVVIDRFGYEVSDYTGATCKFKSKEEAEEYVYEHNPREYRVVEYVNDR